MKFSEFFRLAIVSPAKAFRLGRGKFLVAGVIVGVLSTLPGNYFMGVGQADSPMSSLLVGLVFSLVFLLIDCAIFHGVSRLIYHTRATYTQFLSMFGFTFLPGAFTALATIGAVFFQLIRFRSPDNPALFSFSDPWFVGLVVFGYLMSVAQLIYIGVAIDAVYYIGWKRVVPVMVVGVLLLQVVVQPLAHSFLKATQVSFGALPLTLSGVSYVDAPWGVLTIPYKKAQWVKGESLVAKVGPSSVRALNTSAVALRSPVLMVELMALPGENVAIRDGEVWVNGAVVFSPRVPLTQLNLKERILGYNEVLVYVQSPEALGTLMSAEQFVLNKSDVLGTPRQTILSLFAWVSR